MNNIVDKNNTNNYEGFPYVTFIHENVQSELDRRQSADSRLRSVIPWLKVTSSLKKVSGNNIDSQYKILSPLYTTSNTNHTSFTFDQLYNRNNSFKPLPGIESLDVVYKSKYGGVREASIKWKVYTLDQFEELATYFLNPGIGIFLEWGISDGITEHALPENEYVNISNNNFLESWKYLNNRSYRLGCKYDAMIGIIKNFNYALNSEGGYDCITEVISSGALSYGLGTTYYVTNKGTKTNEEKKSDENKYIESLREYIINGGLENDIKIYYESGPGIDDVKVYVDKNPGKESASNYYVSWGFIEDFIINSHININIIKGKDDTDKSNKIFNMKSKDTNGDSLLISNHPYLRSTDLSICILPQNSDIGGNISGLTFYSDDDVIGKTSGKIRNIFVNVNVIKNAFENQSLLKDAILYILNEINSACVLYWKFSLKVRETDNRLCVIDENYTDKSIRDILNDESNFNKLYNFKTFGGNGILNSVDFSTKMSEAVALTAMYSHHKLPDDNNIVGTNNDSFVYMFGNINTNYTDEFIGNLKIYDIENKNDYKQQENNATSIFDNIYNVGFSTYTLSFLPSKNWRKLVEDNPNSIDEIQAMRKIIFDYSSQNVNTAQSITPADFSISLEGISGLRIGDIFTVDTIPSQFKKNTVFQISGIDHNIDTSGWKTSIKAILRVIDGNINTKALHSVSVQSDNNINKFNQGKHAIVNPDKSVLKWIKTELGPYIRSIATQTYTEDIIAGICYTETAGLIKTYYKNGNAKPNELVEFLVGDAGHAFGFYQIHTNTAADWLAQKNSWKDTRNSSKKCVEILQAKENYLRKYVVNQNIKHAAISAYNQGEGNVRNNILNNRDLDAGNPNQYLSKVLKYAQEYRNLT